MKDASIDDLIDGLASDLKSVRRRRVTRGSLWVAAGWLGVGALLIGLFGARHNLAAGAMPPLSMLAFWLIATAGIAAAWSALCMGLLGVGRDYGGWRWAVGALLALPLAALFVFFGDEHGVEAAQRGFDIHCLLQGVVSGLGVGAALFLWL
ncbi:MAG TPA: NrsF family protein, partial [Sphingopyxis sp.]|nr:NrsF family protein [Sphingopyxis sp.]